MHADIAQQAGEILEELRKHGEFRKDVRGWTYENKRGLVDRVLENLEHQSSRFRVVCDPTTFTQFCGNQRDSCFYKGAEVVVPADPGFDFLLFQFEQKP